MTRTQSSKERTRKTWGFGPWLGGTVIALVVIGGIAWIFGNSANESGATTTASYPGASQEATLVQGVEVVQPWADMGRVPLNTPVQHIYTLRNTGSAPVSLGDASIKVLEGC